METKNSSQHNPITRLCDEHAERGVALVTTLLILMLLVAMTLAMTISVTSDTLINKYYRNARASFYAADSGVNIARQSMISQIMNSLSYSTDYTTETAPISSGEMTTALNNTITQFGSVTSIDGGLGAASWPSKFQIEKTYSGTIGTWLVAPTGTITTPTPTCTPSTTGTLKSSSLPYNCTTNLVTCATVGSCNITGYTYAYTIPYAVTAVGQSIANEQQIVEDEGTITLNITEGQTASPTMSFAGWGMFIDQFPECAGADLVGGTLTGPVFTNGAWTFGESSYTFTGTIGSVSKTLGYDFSATNNGSCLTSTAHSDNSVGQSIAPTFQSTVNLGASAVPLPANDFNQKEAVVDGLGNAWTTENLSTSQQDVLMNGALKTENATTYPSAGTTNPGVYLGYSQTVTGGVTSDNMTGGGIYVEGNADSVGLTASTASSTNAALGQVSGDTLQIFTIAQGSTVTTITEDLTSQKTAFQSKAGSSATATQLISGLPDNVSSGTPSPATMLYVDGNIGSNSTNAGLSGPGQGIPAIQNGAAITVTAAGTVNVTGDILYGQEPVTITSSQSISNTLTTSPCCSGDPVDTLIPYKSEPSSVLGIFTATGNVQLDNQQSNGNLEIDASIATLSTGGSGGIVNPGNAINTLTIVGGRIQNTIQNINTSTRNVDFDQRFASGNFAPPWFPSTTLGATATLSVNQVTATFQRTLWQALN